MFEGLNEEKIPAALEALLFVSDEPVGTITLADMLECDVGIVEKALLGLKDRYQREESGIRLREVAGGWRLFTNSEYHELIEKYVLSWDTRKLTGAAMETLAIIAYTQPVTRADVSSLRGVNSDSTFNSLMEKGLIREVGVAQAVGNPVLYGTTQSFLEKFGLRSVHDLPDLADFAPDEETCRLIEERLSASRDATQITDEQARMLAEDMVNGSDGGENDTRCDPNSEVVSGINKDTNKSSGDNSTEMMFTEAIASTLGVVEKIDFDALEFDTDDE